MLIQETVILFWQEFQPILSNRGYGNRTWCLHCQTKLTAGRSGATWLRHQEVPASLLMNFGVSRWSSMTGSWWRCLAEFAGRQWSLMAIRMCAFGNGAHPYRHRIPATRPKVHPLRHWHPKVLQPRRCARVLLVWVLLGIRCGHLAVNSVVAVLY